MLPAEAPNPTTPAFMLIRTNRAEYRMEAADVPKLEALKRRYVPSSSTAASCHNRQSSVADDDLSRPVSRP